MAIGLVVLAVVLAGVNFVRSDRQHGRITTEAAIVVGLERVLSHARDMETGMRGFALTGSDDYLEPLRDAVRQTDDDDTRLQRAWGRAGGDLGALRELFTAVTAVRDYAERLVDVRRQGGIQAVLDVMQAREGKRRMDAVRTQTALLQRMAGERQATLEAHERVWSVLLTTLSAVCATAACIFFAWLAWHRRRLVQRTSAELSGLDDRFRTLADNIPQLAWMADPTGDIYWYNERWYAYTGMKPADMLNNGWRKAHDPALIEGVSQRFGAAIRSGEPWRDTFPLRGADGSWRWFLSLAQPIRNDKGEVIRWFGTNTDVTEQRQQETELADARDSAEEANRAKSQFLANMSHELRTPLSAVIGYSEMLEEEVQELGEPALLEDLSKIKSNARHLLSLINDVLDISKIEANKMEVFAETFDIAEMVKDVGSTVGSLMEKKANRLEIVASPQLGTMHTDVVKLRQVLINLLSNAAKFTENGVVTLSAKRLGDSIEFSVVDTGLGMSEEQVAKLFQRFTQADASTTRRFGGTGLGLAITKAFSAMLGGSVSVASRQGEGSTFRVLVPSNLPSLPPDETEVVQQDVNEDALSILVIDDDESARDLLKRFLSREGYTVQTAADGRAGLALATALKPKMILLDVTMPRMDGWTVLRNLKDDPHLSAIPVIMCTVIDEQNLGFSLGASDYILKPVNWERLKDVLTRLEASAPVGDVLVVDDDADARERLQVLLSRNGWTVTEAENGVAALAAAETRSPALVLLDLNMPEMDGFTFLRRFRSNPLWTSVPVVVMTARDLSAGERAELKGGGAKVLTKGSSSVRDLVTHLREIHPPPEAAAAGPARAEQAGSTRQPVGAA